MSTQSMQLPTSVDQSELIGPSLIGIRIIGLIQVISYLLIIVGIIVGIIYMIKSKKTKGKRIFIGIVVIVLPIILNLIINIVKFNMILNM